MTFVLVELPALSTSPRSRRAAVSTSTLYPACWTRSVGTRVSVSWCYYVLHHGPGAAGERVARTRMVELGFEDPATGSAACTLSSYLALTSQAAEATFVLTQGVEMGRKSDIVIETSTEIAGGRR